MGKYRTHKEAHLTGFKLPQIILGGQDGLVNVLGVILGVAAATSNSSIVIVAGLAATFAESISMAAVAYTSTLAEAEYYQAELEKETREVDTEPEIEREEIRRIYKAYGFEGDILDKIVAQITSSKSLWLRVMMEQELKLEKKSYGDALPAALIVGFSALVGSFIPLTPYFFLSVNTATVFAVVTCAVMLFIVGYYKAKKTLGRQLIRQGIQMMLIGMVSAFVGYFIGRVFQVPMQ